MELASIIEAALTTQSSEKVAIAEFCGEMLQGAGVAEDEGFWDIADMDGLEDAIKYANNRNIVIKFVNDTLQNRIPLLPTEEWVEEWERNNG